MIKLNLMMELIQMVIPIERTFKRRLVQLLFSGIISTLCENPSMGKDTIPNTPMEFSVVIKVTQVSI